MYRSFLNGPKSASCLVTFRGDVKVIVIYYYDERAGLDSGCCCKSPSFCKSVESAERKIKRFLSNDKIGE